MADFKQSTSYIIVPDTCGSSGRQLKSFFNPATAVSLCAFTSVCARARVHVGYMCVWHLCASASICAYECRNFVIGWTSEIIL